MLKKAFVLACTLATLVTASLVLVLLLNPAHLMSDTPPGTAGLLLVPLALFALCPAVAFIRGPLRQRRRMRTGLCVSCGYNLTGLPEPRCPECGRRFDMDINPMRGPKWIAGLSLAVLALTTCTCMVWEYVPGTLRTDSHGEYFGTGVKVYMYETGNVKLRQKHRAGRVVESTWYRPDGSIVAQVKSKNETGLWYQLREDGSVRMTIEFVNGSAHGRGAYYRPDGTIERVVQYRDGIKVEGETP